MMLMWEFFVPLFYYVCSYKLITSNKTLNARLNMYQRKRQFYTQISVLLKTSFLHVYISYHHCVLTSHFM